MGGKAIDPKVKRRCVDACEEPLARNEVSALSST